MIEFLKRMKWLYALYNCFHKKKLQHNVVLYKQMGLRKRYFSSVSSKDFLRLSTSIPPVSLVNHAVLQDNELFKSLSEANQKSCIDFEENGFAVINNYLSTEQVLEANSEIDALLAAKKVQFSNGNKIMFAIHQSELLQHIGKEKRLTALLDILIGGKATLFQSINFITGSEQHTHSDSIHMTTYPLGGLLGVWIALDDVTEVNGPLHYYPQSHKLPYYLNADYHNEGSKWLLGDKNYTDYETMIAEKILSQNLEKVTFYPKKGDMLIWHANLFHGGNPHLDKTMTRKSMVLHYFKEGSICYHEITQRPALINPI